MGELASKLFTEGDPAVVKKLEDCATGQPTEVASHFTLNQRGEHIRRVQQALKNVVELEPDLEIPEFTVNGEYDRAFANAIAAYKEKRQILNFAKKIDNIVGMQTIRRLDQDARRRRRGEPPPRPSKDDVVPRPLASCVPDGECPTSREFETTLLMGASGGELIEVARFFFSIRDTTNGLSAIYKFEGAGLGFGPTPFTPAVAGTPTHFTTDQPVRVTRFGHLATIIGLTAPPPAPPSIATVTFVSFSYRPDGGRGQPKTPQIRIDSGLISIPGGSMHAGRFVNMSVCQQESGASRRPLGLQDAGGLK